MLHRSNITITITLLGDPIMLGFSKLFGIDTSANNQQAGS